MTDRAASERFYGVVMPRIGSEATFADETFAEWGDFSLTEATDAKPVTRGVHIGFAAASRSDVDAFWRAGVDAGFEDGGTPGERPQYRPDYYGAFLLDPDGSSIEAVHHASVATGGVIDHVWLRVADTAVSRRFYETVADSAGLLLHDLGPEHLQLRGSSGSLSVVAGQPTTGFHFAFPAETDEAVDAFHRTLTEAGYRDGGPPGDRPEYHPGYYGAFVLDPDGSNVELVNHNRTPSTS